MGKVVLSLGIALFILFMWKLSFIDDKVIAGLAVICCGTAIICVMGVFAEWLEGDTE